MKYRPFRYPNRIKASVIQDGVSRLVDIENASKGGLRLLGLRSIMAGDILVLRVLGQQTKVEVRWVDRNRCGVEYLDVGENIRASILRHALLRTSKEKRATRT